MANFGYIELIPWGSRVGSLDRPDYLVIDLDPVDVPFSVVVEVALAVRRVLDKAGAMSCPKIRKSFSSKHGEIRAAVRVIEELRMRPQGRTQQFSATISLGNS